MPVVRAHRGRALHPLWAVAALIHQVLMGCGDCSIKLKPDAPLSVRLRPRLRDHIVITPGRIIDTAMTPTALKANARYSFRIDSMKDRLTFSGPTILAWLGDGDSPGKGELHNLVSAARTLTQLVTDLAFPINGITSGTPYSSPAYSMTDAVTYETARDALRRWCAVSDGEYRVNASGSFDWGARINLWRFAAQMTTVLMRGAGGSDFDVFDGLDVVDFSVEESGTEYVNGATVTDPAPGISTGPAELAGGFDAGSSASIFHYEADDVAGAAGGRYGAIVERFVDTEMITARVQGYDIARYFTASQPGDYVYVYDPETGLVSTDNQIPYRGGFYPMRSDLRVVEMTTPVQQGMGVYYYRTAYDNDTSTAGDESIVDWSDFVEYETGDATLVLGKTKPIGLVEAVNGNR